MPWIVLVLDLAFLVVAFGVRTLVQLRATDDSGWRLGRPHSRGEAAARAFLFGAFVCFVASIGFGFRDGSERTLGIVQGWGVVLVIAAIALVFTAQLQMGASWRIGVAAGERTELVTAGLYRWIRNPIYTGMVMLGVGQAMMLPSAWTVAALVALVAGVEVQVRAVEEPYLHDVHGRAFVAWSAATGRFVSLLGRT